MKKIIMIASVASMLALCKPLFAEEESLDPNIMLDGFKIGGYSSTSISVPRDATTELAVDELSLILTWQNESRLNIFGEFELERPLIWNNGHGLTTRDAYFDLERLYLDYNFSEKVNLRIGRFLTPNSRWNLLHASPLVWTSTRPIATYRLFPTGTNGVMLHGSVPVSDYALDYMVFGELLEDQEDDDYDLPFEHVRGARIALSKQWNIGVSVLSFREKNVDALNNKNQSYRMLGLDFVTHLGDVEVSGEGFARFTPSGNDGGSGAYLQTAVPLNALGLTDWYWLTRLETMQRPNEGSSERWLTGATWRVKPTQLLKLEFTGGNGEQPEAPRGFIASFAFLF